MSAFARPPTPTKKSNRPLSSNSRSSISSATSTRRLPAINTPVRSLSRMSMNSVMSSRSTLSNTSQDSSDSDITRPRKGSLLSKSNLDRLNRTENFRLISTGKICYWSYPCKHDVTVINRKGKEEVQRLDASQIWELFVKADFPDIDGYGVEHFEEYGSYHDRSKLWKKTIARDMERYGNESVKSCSEKEEGFETEGEDATHILYQSECGSGRSTPLSSFAQIY